MEQDKRLEDILNDIMIPNTHFEDVINKTKQFEMIYGYSFKDYRGQILAFAVAGKRDYKGFRDFLDKHAESYLTHNLCDLSNREISYLFDRVVELTADSVLERFDKS